MPLVGLSDGRVGDWIMDSWEIEEGDDNRGGWIDLKGARGKVKGDELVDIKLVR